MSDAIQGLEYAVDIVLCIYATASMRPVLDMVKGHALKFYDDLNAALLRKHKSVTQIRARFIIFRDLRVDGDQAMLPSRFFLLPAE